MKVTVYIFLQFHTGWACSARVTLSPVAEKIVGKSNGNGKFSVAARTGQQQRMRKTVVVDTAPQLLYHSPLPYYVFKENSPQ